MKKIYWGNSPIKEPARTGKSGMVEWDGETCFRIADFSSMPPFFIAVVSGSEHWMFLSSKGGLTCGRRNPENALFPYYTDDKIHDAGTTTGSLTAMLVDSGGETRLWQPFYQGAAVYTLERNLYKNLAGNRLIFEEVNHDLGLAFWYSWSTSERFGFVKRSGIRNTGTAECGITFVDGIRNLLPYGVTRRTQNELSTLLDAYKQAERVPGMAAGIFSQSSILTDRAEPSEALKATVAWSVGLEQPQVLLSEDQLAAFYAGEAVIPEESKRGKRGAFFVQSSITLSEGGEESWYVIADINQGPAQVPALLRDIREGVTPADIEDDIKSGERRLVELVGGADGCQVSSDVMATARHFSNTLFNIMRGGTFYNEYRFPVDDFLSFVQTWNAPLRERFSAMLEDSTGPCTLDSVLSAAEESGDADMIRLALEYLPLIFSRRHGDPSRPWNQFSIDIKNSDGSDKLYYQGNWRDIFQNWEALSISFPEYIESFIAKFVNASTADGYNPYRITKEGIDWEVLEPEDPWSNIGYWGDHQVNYLLKLLELSRKYHPGRLGALLSKDIFVFANVPYRIKGYSDLRSDPRDSVIYDAAEEAAIARRVEEIGSDGKLLNQHDGRIYKVNLLEKLLLPVITKTANFVPGGGIWMNTQRPEWNDANNALAGYGLSMVTLCYLRRYLRHFEAILGEGEATEYLLSEEVLRFFAAVDGVLQKFRSDSAEPESAASRKAFMDEMGVAGEAYRNEIYEGFGGAKRSLDKQTLLDFISLALEYFDKSIASNRRPDGLFHSYNLIHFDEDGYEVENLYEMLEGQVAVLSSGYLGADEAKGLLDSLKASAIYRSDQNSYMLYPDKEQVPFLDRNTIPHELADENRWICNELESGNGDIVEKDVDGKIHFNFRFRNAVDLAAALAERGDVGPDDANAVLSTYEAVFRHRQFTGRSGSMFKYEGLGSIYWHMVSKLLLATAEIIHEADGGGSQGNSAGSLLQHFDEIKNGIGFYKQPEEYGAFPTDPYSHTPGFTGVQQPGMTGQVKEDVITRFLELGVNVEQGQVEFAPVILRRSEFLTEADSWNNPSQGSAASEELEAGSLAFSLCSVPVIYRLAQSYRVQVFGSDGECEVIADNRLGPDASGSLFRRDGSIRKIIVDIPRDRLRQT
jgi:hypothetical protein